ncbi:hypothetical protein D3C75_1081940 [compost metagenome]
MRGMNSTSMDVATGYSMPTPMPISNRSRNMPIAVSTHKWASEAPMNSSGPMKYTLRRPRWLVSQPPRNPPKNTPIRDAAAIRPSQNVLNCNVADICARATPITHST